MLTEGLALGTIAAALAVAGSRAEGDQRRLLWGWAAASVPLAAGLWANAAALPRLAAGGPAPSLAAGDLWSKLQLLAVGGLAPALLAWWAVRGTSTGRRLREGLSQDPLPRRAAGGAAVTLAAVAAAGGSIAFLAALGAGGHPVGGLWAGASPVLVVSLSLVAAAAEELLFRGVLLSSLVEALDWRTAGALQAGLFGLFHAGYGDLTYVVAAGAFGLVQVSVTRAWGLRVALLVHAQVNLVILGWAARGVSPLNPAIVALVLGANLLLLPIGLRSSAGEPTAGSAAGA